MKRWVFGRDNFGYRTITDVDKDGAIMCDATYYPWTPDDDEDWRLMAAAPELLEALQGLAAMLNGERLHDRTKEDVFRQVKDAIRKATEA